MGHFDFFGIAPILFILNYYKVYLFYRKLNFLHRGLKIIHIFNMKGDHICVGTRHEDMTVKNITKTANHQCESSCKLNAVGIKQTSSYCFDIHALCSKARSGQPTFFLKKSTCLRNCVMASIGTLCWNERRQICRGNNIM